MAATNSTRFFFSDWMADRALRACSYAAKGLWMDLLAIMHENQGAEHGFLTIKGKPLSDAEVAKITGGTTAEVELLVEELERYEVCSRDRRGAIYSRRMVREEKNRVNGRLGGERNREKGVVAGKKIGATGGVKRELNRRYSKVGMKTKPLENKRNQNSLEAEAKPHMPMPIPVSSPEIVSTSELNNTLFDSLTHPASAKAPAVVDDWPDDFRERFWKLYPPPRKTDKAKVFTKLEVIRKRGGVPWAKIVDALERYVRTETVARGFAKGPLVWLNGGCWDDEYSEPPSPPRGGPAGGKRLTMADIAAGNFHGESR